MGGWWCTNSLTSMVAATSARWTNDPRFIVYREFLGSCHVRFNVLLFLLRVDFG